MDYEWALAEIASYLETVPTFGSPEGDRFDVLADLIEAYENRYWQIDAPDRVQVLEVYMEMRDPGRSDLASPLGRAHASEVLKRRRLSLDMIHKINKAWHIPANVVIVPYHLTDAGQETTGHQHM